MCQADNLETQPLNRWSAEHKFWGNKIIGKFMTIKTSLHDTENV